MKTFTIDEENNITVFATKKEAAAASTTPFDAFTSQSDLAELTGEYPVQRLVEIWNGIPGVTAVTKFTSRKIATERIWKAIQNLGASAPVEQAQEPIAEKAEPAAEAPTEETIEAGAEEPAAALEKDSALQVEVSEPAPAQAEPEAPVASAEPVANVDAQAPDVATAAAESTKKASRSKKAPKVPKVAKPAKSESGPRETKTAQVVAMLQLKNGATLQEIMDLTSWLPHTVRGFMAGAMKKPGTPSSLSSPKRATVPTGSTRSTKRPLPGPPGFRPWRAFSVVGPADFA